MGKGRKQSEFVCGYTMVILFADYNYVGFKNLRFYSRDLVDTTPSMQVTEEWFKVW